MPPGGTEETGGNGPQQQGAVVPGASSSQQSQPSPFGMGLFRGMTASGFAGGFGFGSSDEPTTSSMMVGQPVQHPKSILDKFVMRQNNIIRRIWEILLAVVLIYVATLLPFKITFVEGALHGTCVTFADNTTECTADAQEAIVYPFWDLMDLYVMEPFFIGDVILNFFFSYQDATTGREMVHFFPCVKRYLRMHFWVDVVASIRSNEVQLLVNFFAGVGEGDGSNVAQAAKVGKLRVVQRATKLTRLVRLARLLKIVSFLNQNETWMKLKDLRSVRLLNFLFGLLWAVHIFACAWYYVAVMHNDHMNTWVGQRGLYDGQVLIEIESPVLAWIHSMYFVMTTFTTVGFGDMSAKTVGEIGFVMLLMIAGIFVNSIILSSAINIWNSVDETAQAIDEQKKVVEGFGEHTHLSLSRVVELKESVGQTSIGTSYDRAKMKSLLTSSALPREIITQLPKEIFHGRLERNKLITCCSAVYRHLPPRFSLLVALWCNMRMYQRNEIVYYCHDHAWNVFLVFDGVFAALAIATPNGGMSTIPPAGLNAVEAFSARVGGRKVEPAPTPGNSSKSAGTLSPNKSALSVDAPARANSRSSNKGSNKMMATPSMVHRGEATTLSPYKLYTMHNYFGDTELLLEPGPRRACTRCESKTGSLLVLSKNDILDLLQEFPPCADAWRIASRRREEHDKDMLKNLTWAPTTRPPDAFRPGGWFPHEDLAAAYIGREWRGRCGKDRRRGGGYAITHSERQVVQTRKAAQRTVEWVPEYARDMSQTVDQLRTEVTDLQAQMKSELSGLHSVMRTLREDIARLPVQKL